MARVFGERQMKREKERGLERKIETIRKRGW